jgi:hypothetical protein
MLLLAGLVVLASASARHRQASRDLTGVAGQVERLTALQRGRPATGDPATADGALLARIQQALGQVGLPPAACTGVMPRGDEVRPGGGERRHLVAVTLGGFSIADLGGWLAAFRSDGNPWRVEEVQCLAGAGEGGLDRNRYAVSILLATTAQESAP